MSTPNRTQNSSSTWTGTGAHGWVASQDLIDQTYQGIADLLTDAVGETAAEHVLDVGCGTGGTTIAIARLLDADGRCLGVDISEAMITAARARAARDGVTARFVCADAETHAFDPASVSLIVSRFGVMFFEDPVRAFANLRRAGGGGARLRCVVWRDPAENPFLTTAEQAAEPLLPGVSKRVPNEPGPFGLADRDRVWGILRDSGWHGIEIEPIDVPCAFPSSALDAYLSRLGPVGRALQGADDATKAKVVETIRPAFNAFVHGAQVRFTAACWLMDARVGGS